MKSEITNNHQPAAKLAYPYLGEFSNGVVVLFTSVSTGMVVFVGDNVETGDYVGKHSKYWSESSCTVFTGELTISNFKSA